MEEGIIILIWIKKHIFFPIRRWRQCINNKLDGFSQKKFFYMIKQVLCERLKNIFSDIR
jgi:hypothetical protein